MMRVLINFVFMLKRSLFKERPPGKLFLSQQTLCLTCPCLPVSIPNVLTQAIRSYCFHLCIFIFSKSPFLQLSALFSPKIAESQECDRIESQLADWIVFCSISGCIKRLRLWTYKKVMDASSKRLDRLELTSAEGRKGKKKRETVIYWPGQWKQRGGWMPLCSHGWQPQM